MKISGDDFIELRSTITCPDCGHKKEEIMPSEACAYYYECEKCRALLKPLKGDCCVYCSYGTVKCPPMQSSNPCCERKPGDPSDKITDVGDH